jgi:hypothetical protein
MGLIVLLSSKSYDPKIAAAQLNDVVKLQDILQRDPTELPTSDALVKNHPRADSDLSYHPWLEGAEGTTRYLFHLPDHLHLFCKASASVPPSSGSWEVISGKQYTTLRDFSRWDANSDHWDIITISTITANANLTPHDGGPSHSIPLNKSKETQTQRWIELSPVGSCDEEHSLLVNPYVHDKTSDIELLGENGGDKFTIWATSVKRTSVRSGDLKSTFHYAFQGTWWDSPIPDLIEAAADKDFEDRDLETLATPMLGEATKDEGFDAFGMHIPRERVGKWGVILLVAVQLYLLIYLKQLFNKLRPKDSGWDVPWMALNQSTLARAMFFCSVIPLPVAAAVFVTYKGTVEPFNIFGILICAWLSVLCWKYRPKLKRSRV